MPVQRPFNEEMLWKGKIQKANYPEATPKPKPPMDLPKINTIVGGTIKDPRKPIWEGINDSYKSYSSDYWAGVRVRNLIYRYRQQFSSSPSHSEKRWPF